LLKASVGPELFGEEWHPVSTRDANSTDNVAVRASMCRRDTIGLRHERVRTSEPCRTRDCDLGIFLHTTTCPISSRSARGTRRSRRFMHFQACRGCSCLQQTEGFLDQNLTALSPGAHLQRGPTTGFSKRPHWLLSVFGGSSRTRALDAGQHHLGHVGAMQIVNRACAGRSGVLADIAASAAPLNDTIRVVL
jgi:hypothetical protein